MTTPNRRPVTPTSRPQLHPIAGHPLPEPTIWPAVLAAGMTLLPAGIVLGPLVAGVGACLIAIAVGGWVRNLIAEAGGSHEDSNRPPDSISGNKA